MSSDRCLVRRLHAPEAIDLRLTLGPLQHGRGDRTIRFEGGCAWLGLRFDGSPATLALRANGGAIEARACGPAADAALDAAPGIAGLLDKPGELIARHPIVRELQRRFVGLRLPRTGQIMPSLVPAILEQKVTSIEAHAAYTKLLRRTGEPAPEPPEPQESPEPPSQPERLDGQRGDRGARAVWLLLPPRGDVLAALPYFEYHPLGLERRRAEVLRHIGRMEPKIEALMASSPAGARVALQEIAGIGPWTAAEVTRMAFGDPDAVSVGDAHIPSMVSWALAGELRADDERMLELLEPYAGQRARVVRLLEAAGIMAPRRTPRMTPREISRI